MKGADPWEWSLFYYYNYYLHYLHYSTGLWEVDLRTNIPGKQLRKEKQISSRPWIFPSLPHSLIFQFYLFPAEKIPREMSFLQQNSQRQEKSRIYFGIAAKEVKVRRALWKDWMGFPPHKPLAALPKSMGGSQSHSIHRPWIWEWKSVGEKPHSKQPMFPTLSWLAPQFLGALLLPGKCWTLDAAPSSSSWIDGSWASGQHKERKMLPSRECWRRQPQPQSMNGVCASFHTETFQWFWLS